MGGSILKAVPIWTLIILSLAIAIWITPVLLPRHVRDINSGIPSWRVSMIAATDIYRIYAHSGVRYSSLTYVSSSFGRPFAPISASGITRMGALLSHLKIIPVRDATGEAGARVSVKWGGLAHHVMQPLTDASPKVTRRLLVSSSAGIAFWRNQVETSRVYSYMRTKLQLPGLRLASMLPTTEGELTRYRQWLAQVLGSPRMLVDGWGHPVRLSLDHGQRRRYSLPAARVPMASGELRMIW